MVNPGHSILLVGLLMTTSTVAAEPAPAVHIDNAWVRAMPPSQTTTAAYLSVSNHGDRDLHMTGASSDLTDRVEIHTSREVGGIMRMEEVDKLLLAPEQTVRLAPGGTHMMLLGLARMPVTGELVRLCVEFESAGAACTQAEVRRTEPKEKLHRHAE